jgi:hypothetical protein
MRIIAAIIAGLTLTASAATLEKLSIDDLVAKSTDIVRGKVTGSSSSFRGTAGKGGMIYTHYSIQVSERWKGAAAAKMDVAVPGGTAQGYRQVFAGAPALRNGDEFVFFLWTSRSGLTQIIGLTQGLFSLTADATGKLVLNRASSNEIMLEPATGRPVADSGLKLNLQDLARRVAAAKAEK